MNDQPRPVLQTLVYIHSGATTEMAVDADGYAYQPWHLNKDGRPRANARADGLVVNKLRKPASHLLVPWNPLLEAKANPIRQKIKEAEAALIELYDQAYAKP